MDSRPSITFLCAHLADERLFAAQMAALAPTHACSAWVFREHDTLGAMADAFLARAPSRFTLVGLSMGGYLAFEVLRRAPERVERLVLLDTTAAADPPARRAGRLADLARVEREGLEALIPELPARWLLPAHRERADLVALLGAMARAVGAAGQAAQQRAMLARPDSFDELRRVRVPTLIACGRQDLLTPPADHEAMAACVAGARLEIIDHCGHLSALEQPAALARLLVAWLRETAG